jgi:hypothetical protein
MSQQVLVCICYSRCLFSDIRKMTFYCCLSQTQNRQYGEKAIHRIERKLGMTVLRPRKKGKVVLQPKRDGTAMLQAGTDRKEHL